MAKDLYFQRTKQYFWLYCSLSLSLFPGKSILLNSSVFIGTCGPVIKGNWELHVVGLFFF